jgi:prepilin-type N-terminal cleavage/methylation domain-containing protein
MLEKLLEIATKDDIIRTGIADQAIVWWIFFRLDFWARSNAAVERDCCRSQEGVSGGIIMVTCRRKGFTLIELLIVVAIIGILAAIAIPNFLEAQVRAKVARVRGEFHTLATALEVYYVDNDAYVNCLEPWGGGLRFVEPAQRRLGPLTTPVEFLTTLPWQDPFEPEGPPGWFQSGYQYQVYKEMKVYGDGVALMIFDWLDYPAWILSSRGPDGMWLWEVTWGLGVPWEESRVDYDASNGTVSLGEVRRLSSARAVP